MIFQSNQEEYHLRCYVIFWLAGTTVVMLTAKGPKVLEYNVRFGDPECQALLMSLRSSILDLFDATIDGTLASHRLEWAEGTSVCVVLTAQGYPKMTFPISQIAPFGGANPSTVDKLLSNFSASSSGWRCKDPNQLFQGISK